MNMDTLVLLFGAFLLIWPVVHVLGSGRSHGGAKFGWFLAVFFFSWLAYIVFLILTQRTIDEKKIR